MANSITQAKTYVPLLDVAFKEGILTAPLNLNQELVQLGANGKDILVPKLSLQGLGDTTRGGSYVAGDATLAWETITPGWDRNRAFTIDAMDNVEVSNAFAMLSGEFIRTKVVPEFDAYVFHTLAQTSGIDAVGTAATLDTAAKVITAVNAAYASMTDNEVPMEGRILYITPALAQLVVAADTTASREVFTKFAQVVQVPQGRFYTKISLTADGAGGYAKDSTNGKDINFMIVHPASVLAVYKHQAPKIVSPEVNQTGDNWIFGYRVYGVVKVFDNKAKGVYLHNKA